MSGFDAGGVWPAIEPVPGPALPDLPGLDEAMAAEFPAVAALARGPNRRRVLRLMAASLGLGGLSACSRAAPRNTQGKLIPYVHPPARVVPSAALAYASAAVLDGLGNGILVTTRNGRPVKVEGNPGHPWSLGGTDIFAQASILGLYDPDRSQAVRQYGRIADWTGVRAAMRPEFARLRASGGAGLRVLTGPVSSPTLIASLAAMRASYPAMRWHQHAPLAAGGEAAAMRALYGRPLATRWRFDKAELVVSLDGDFLDPGPSQVGLAERWSAARRRLAAGGTLLALRSASPTPGLTTAKADYPIVVGAREMAPLAHRLLARIGGTPPAPADGPLARWEAETAAALLAARGRAIVLTGAHQSLEVHEAVERLNLALGNLDGGDAPVFHTESPLADAPPLAPLLDEMRAGAVDTLLMLDANPAYTASGDGFAEALGRVRLKLHAGEYVDETAVRADWHLPLAHPLESWGDVRAADGTASLLQPMLEPLYDGRSSLEILSLLADDAPRDGLALLRQGWRGRLADAAAWEGALQAGFVDGTALPPVAAGSPGVPVAAPAPAAASGGLDVLVRPDPTVHDGRAAQIGWLQELPKPLTKIVWQNVIGVGPGFAAREGLRDGDLVTVSVGARSVTGPAWTLPGQHDGAVTLYLGYGRRQPGTIADGLGYDAYVMRDGPIAALAGGALARAGGRRAVASTQHLFEMEGHDFARAMPLGAPPPPSPPAASLYPPWPTDGYAWGMVIDLDACIGCNACVVACQAENNIPVIGAEEVARGRNMHWLRIDRYSEGPAETPDTRFMPVPCMQCEQAPCELGCPVEATVHDHEGLNVMVYNRCVGTRACAAYCPYKVRHFNFEDYALSAPPSVQAQYNPEVTVRGRGVMEKCTYCVQRIEAAHITAGVESRPIRDGEVRTACQGACPTRAIDFGNLADRASSLHAGRASPRHYALLAELGTRPRTTYLAKLAPGAAG